MEIQLRRKYKPDFIKAVHDGLAADRRDTSAVAVSTTAKLLYTNTVLPQKIGGKMQIAENPHHLGANVATIHETIARLGL
jgi:hypothetical protein